MNSPQDWINSKYTVADLHDKTVEYQMRGPDGHIYSGDGKLIAVSKGNLMRVRVCYFSGLSADCRSVEARAFIIDGKDSAKLVKNPPGSNFEFSFRAL